MRTLLVADDNRLSRELIRDAFESPTCRVVAAVNGRDALERLEEASPALVLLDIDMPALDGFAVLEAIRSHPRFARVPVIAVTASAMQMDRGRIEAAGFHAYVTKPISIQKLRERVDQLLRSTPEGDPT